MFKYFSPTKLTHSKDKDQQWVCTHPLVRKFSLTKNICNSTDELPFIAKICLLKGAEHEFRGRDIEHCLTRADNYLEPTFLLDKMEIETADGKVELKDRNCVRVSFFSGGKICSFDYDSFSFIQMILNSKIVERDLINLNKSIDETGFKETVMDRIMETITVKTTPCT